MASQSNKVDSEDTFMKMKCDELAEALSKILDDKSYEKDLKKLKDGNIDGKLFLTLLDDPDLLMKLGLTAGGEAKVKKKVKEIKDGSLKFGQSDSQKLSVPWCSTVTPPKPVVMPSGSGNWDAATGGGMKKAVIPPDAVWSWKDKKELYVEFKDVHLLAKWTIDDGQPMNTDTILRYANTWRDLGGEEIPRFVEANYGRTPQIRVSFNDNQIRKSELGMRAQSIPAKKPTMNLDLHTECLNNDEYKKHLIIHEFGHALGLGHEHQRSDFWKCIKPFTDIKKMKEDLGVTEEQFANDWKEIDFSTSKPVHATDYDPESIMHYWFRIEWLTNGYSDKEKIEEDLKNKYLGEKVAKALLGVHKRHINLAPKPSDLDIQLLQRIYRDVAGRHTS